MENDSTTETYTESSPQPQLIIGKIEAGYLLTASNWATFLSVLGFILTGLMVLGGIWMMVFMNLMMPNQAMREIPGPFGQWMFGFMGGFYILIALFYLFPTLYLFQFARKIKFAIQAMNQVAMTQAFQNLKSLFKFVGIFTIVLISLYVLAVVIFVLAATVGGIL